MRFILAATTILGAADGLHEWHSSSNVSPDAHRCVPPGQCTPPSTAYAKVINGPVPGQQWNINGGFCGAFSTQHAALGVGAWVSQDLVRKANRLQPGPHFMHGDKNLGFEVMPSNVAATARGLRLAYDEWDYTQPSPQAPAFKRWLKAHLAKGHAIVWFPMCKGDPHVCYPLSCPNGGHVDHVEVMYGLYSNKPLDDPEVYDDDWIVHTSDQDYMPYYRPFHSLEDSPKMDGNCKDAGSGFGRNEMYPCFDESLTYALAVTGLNVSGATLPVSITTDGAVYEPNVRSGEAPKDLTASVTVGGLTPNRQYTVYRYDGTSSVPSGPPFDAGASHSTRFTSDGPTHTFDDPVTFKSDAAVYYIAVAAASGDDAHTVEAASAAAAPPPAPPIPSVPIAPGVKPLPMVSLGTGSGQHADVAAATALWLRVGGRAIDTAHDYRDEPAVAAGIARSALSPSDLFITTKISCGTYDAAAEQVDDNLRQLGVASVDLTLIHFNKCWGSKGASLAETWRALEDARAAGKSKAIGVSNFAAADLVALKRGARYWPPAVNQMSTSVGYHDDATMKYCDGEGITYMAYSPLCGGSNGSSCSHGSVMTRPQVVAIARAHGVSPAQVALKWLVQQGRPLATAVAREEYAREDLDLWSWGNLTADEMATLARI